MFSQVKKEQDKKEKMINDFERNVGLKLKTLNEYEDENDQAINNPQEDAAIFKHVIKDTYGSLRRAHRDIVDSVRTREFDTFSRVSASRASTRPERGAAAYNKIEDEVKKIKDKVL